MHGQRDQACRSPWKSEVVTRVSQSPKAPGQVNAFLTGDHRREAPDWSKKYRVTIQFTINVIEAKPPFALVGITTMIGRGRIFTISE